jgi:hypothetical protein
MLVLETMPLDSCGKRSDRRVLKPKKRFRPWPPLQHLNLCRRCANFRDFCLEDRAKTLAFLFSYFFENSFQPLYRLLVVH